MERRQVAGLPEVTVTVTEHQLIERECGCGHRTKGMAPQGAEAPAQYGPRIAAIIVYLYLGQFLSKQRTAQALAAMFGIPLSPGTVAGITARAAGRLAASWSGYGAPSPRPGGRVRRDRIPRRWPAALGTLRPHRQVHPAHGAPQAQRANITMQKGGQRIRRPPCPGCTPRARRDAGGPGAGRRPAVSAWARVLKQAGLESTIGELRARAFLDILLGMDSRPARDPCQGTSVSRGRRQTPTTGQCVLMPVHRDLAQRHQFYQRRRAQCRRSAPLPVDCAPAAAAHRTDILCCRFRCTGVGRSGSEERFAWWLVRPASTPACRSDVASCGGGGGAAAAGSCHVHATKWPGGGLCTVRGSQSLVSPSQSGPSGR